MMAASKNSDGVNLALYRKYRPTTFTDVLGQEHVVKVLQGAVKQGNIAHAYLFAGSRGTGKTSVARIFAREIGTSEKDLYEIDAASNRGIDEIRALREGVVSLPFDSKYKIYIVDEVHMLTKEAANAFLKTLEEPPEHVVFILATTEPDRLPETVLSRCQTFTFKKPSREVLKKMISTVAKEEGYTLESASGDLIAILADGSFRDALGILQKILSTSPDKKVSVAEVETVTGAPRNELINECLMGLSEGDLKRALGAVGEAVKANVEMKVFLTLLLEKVRAVLLARFAKDMHEELEEQLGAEDFELVKGIAAKKESRIRSDSLERLLEAYTQMNYAYLPHLPLELALIELCGQDESAT